MVNHKYDQQYLLKIGVGGMSEAPYPPHPSRMQGVLEFGIQLQIQLQGRFTSPPSAGPRETAALAKTGLPAYYKPSPLFGPVSDTSQIPPGPP